uniref:Cytochrome c oxidase subunit 2 n=1 Tax=Sceliphron madraspatanum TaxID=2008740 RepID=A0A343DRF5_9HYME|nr:cytochrome c oxidase subunit 2 [Sceliphron madraspatanum]
MSTWMMIKFQDSNSPISENLIFFYDLTMMISISITIIILTMMWSIITNKMINRFLIQGHNIEIIWTIIPMMILIYLAIPSINILYLMDEMNKPLYTIKAIGHQWYWSYEYNDLNYNIKFDSYMQMYSMNKFRLLDVDNHMIIPMKTSIRLMVTSMDVIHSWAMPSLAIKIDASPGRLNQTNLFLNRPGIFYGQCSEICGMNHSFMPIVLESTSLNNFKNWLSSM